MGTMALFLRKTAGAFSLQLGLRLIISAAIHLFLFILPWHMERLLEAKTFVLEQGKIKFVDIKSIARGSEGVSADDVGCVVMHSASGPGEVEVHLFFNHSNI
jgi:hypothetical protein